MTTPNENELRGCVSSVQADNPMLAGFIAHQKASLQRMIANYDGQIADADARDDADGVAVLRMMRAECERQLEALPAT